jgi:hypothetical protein
MAETFTPPAEVASRAREALEVRAEKPPSSRGMTPIGLARARDLANRRPVSLDVIRRMVAYFDRHESDKDGSSWSEYGAGRQAWNGWGGDPGRTWAREILANAEREMKSAEYVQKPYPNEHAARQKDPAGYLTFRRGPLPGAPEGLSAIFGIRPDGRSEIQALRFDRKRFSVAAAKDWLRQHGYKIGDFEEATGGKVSPKKLPIALNLPIKKLDEEQRLAFGWLYVNKRADGTPVVDHSGETISLEELEKAGYRFALESRKAKAMHTGPEIGRLAEILVSTPEKRAAMGIPEGTIPDGIWIGVKVDDPETWEGVKSGRYKMFSLGGKAIRRALTDNGEEAAR